MYYYCKKALSLPELEKWHSGELKRNVFPIGRKGV